MNEIVGRARRIVELAEKAKITEDALARFEERAPCGFANQWPGAATGEELWRSILEAMDWDSDEVNVLITDLVRSHLNQALLKVRAELEKYGIKDLS